MDENLKTNNTTDLSAAIEALLFIYGEPLEIKRIAKITTADESVVAGVLENLKNKYSQTGGGLMLISEENKTQLVSKPQFSGLIENFVKEEFTETLTPAALETLAIIAYAAPISRSIIDYIRGVNSTFILRTLLIRGLIDRKTDARRSNAYVYAPTFDLLKHLGIANSGSLPEYSKFRDLVEKLNNANDASIKVNDTNHVNL